MPADRSVLLGALGGYLAALGHGLSQDAAGDGLAVDLYRRHIEHAASLLDLLDHQEPGDGVKRWIEDGNEAYGRSFLPGDAGAAAEERFHELAAELASA